ncbi:glycogen synthase GlgA [Roseococcus sp. DSY-14]|uniref:glycogen synthase GlgA n=1 Tax=Roseococcus sp. DSY-14 TaxID=3369650 RepID=UPI00387B12FA
MRVLAVASEVFPLVKTGGLADVAGALPAALAREGIAVTTLLPGYPAVMAALAGGEAALAIPDLFGGPARLLRAAHAGLDLLVLDAPHLFARPGGPYAGPDGRDWGDNPLRFAAFAAAGARAARDMAFDAVHAHDWQAGLLPAYLAAAGSGPRTLFTVHNLAFQGQFPAALFPALGLPPAFLATEGAEYHGGVGYLKAGLWFAARLSTVSPGYAAEITTPEGGMGLDGLLRGRAAVLEGIANGLDTAEWDPAADHRLPARFDARRLGRRAANRAALRARFALAEAEAPLIGFVGRLSWQKGVDLLLAALPVDAQLALLGSGEPGLEQAANALAAANPGRVGVVLGYDEALARLVYAGCDLFAMPSRFEPCGLGQLCALRYGAPPVVSFAGGLADTVVNANDAALAMEAGTGFCCAPGSAPLLGAALRRAGALWRDAPAWAALQRRGMGQDLSWARPARRYAATLRALA